MLKRIKYRHRVLGMVFLVGLITFLDRVCISVAGPRMQADLHIPTEKWGWVVGAFTLSYCIFEIPTGMLADRFGPRKVLTRIVLWWSVFTTATGLTRSFPLLLTARFLFGAGEAGAYPNISAVIARWFPAEERGRAQGTGWMAGRLGGALAPLLVVPIQMRYGWRASFLCFGGLGVVWAAAWYAWFRDRPSEKAGVSQKELEEIGPGVPRKHLMFPWALARRSRNFWTIVAMYHCYCWGSNFYLSWLHTYIQKGRHFDEGRMAILSSLPFILGASGNLFGGWASDALSKRYGLKVGRRTIGAAGLTLGGLFLLLAAVTKNNLTAILFLALGYGSLDCMVPCAWAVCLDVGKEFAGAMTASMNTSGQVGSLISSVAYGYMVTYFHSYDTPLIPLACVVFVSALLFTQIDPDRPIAEERARHGIPGAVPV